MASEVRQLIMAGRFDRLSVAVDPWAGLGTIGEILPVKTYSTDLNPIYWHEPKVDALTDSVLDWMCGCNADVKVCSPWFTALDMAIPRLLSYGAPLVCIHAPAHYVTNMPSPRRNWLANYTTAGLLVVIGLRDIGPLGRRCCWLLFFKDHSAKRRLFALEEGTLSRDGFSNFQYFI